MIDFFSWTLVDAKEWAVYEGLKAFRGQQVFDALHRNFAQNFDDIHVLPQELREKLTADGQLLPATEHTRQESADGTVKSLLELHDGCLVECVSIPTETRHTICVSSQVGCSVGCTFCASGINGVTRDCTAGEIVYQVLFHHQRRPVTNVVFMGSGEPMFNYDNVRQAIAVLCDQRGIGLGKRRITVSTSGVPDRIRQFGHDEPQVTLALSLHAPDNDTRSQLMPINRRWPLTELLSAMDDYSQLVNRRMTIEYVLLKDVNMSTEQALQLAALGKRYHAHINLIPFNAVGSSAHDAPSDAEVLQFSNIVRDNGGIATLRGQRGADIDAACGQLAIKKGGKKLDC